jgi:hypothetical protein
VARSIERVFDASGNSSSGPLGERRRIRSNASFSRSAS